MADYLESYLRFSISVQVTDDVRHAGSFHCQEVNIDSPEGKRIMSMCSTERFQFEAEAGAFGLDWAKAWIDNNTAAGKT